MKYGKKNIIRLDPLAYNLALIGESGIGKTTIIKNYCEKLAGENGYLFANIGKEDGYDAISGINYINCYEWDGDYNETDESIGFIDLINDIVENKTTEWKDLKVLVIDTYDELFAIAEPKVIRMHNKENPNKRVTSIKAAYGGFQGGEDKAVEIVLDALWSLKKVGVSFIVIGHTKTSNKTDAITGESYLQLTTNLSQKYFNAIKTKVHLLGVAAIDREIVNQKTGKKNPVTHQDITKGVVKSETRQITFRDDNYVIDSKSRFANIVDKIPMDVDALIEAITNAIASEQEKSGIDIKKAQKYENEIVKNKEKQIEENEKNNKENNKRDEIISKITTFFVENKSSLDIIRPVMSAIKELGYSKPTEIKTLEEANSIYKLIG